MVPAYFIMQLAPHILSMHAFYRFVGGINITQEIYILENWYLINNFFLLQCLEEVKIDLLFVLPGLYYIYKNTLYYPIISLNLYYIPYFSYILHFFLSYIPSLLSTVWTVISDTRI